MADLGSSDVTVTALRSKMERVGRLRMQFLTIAFGDGAKTYPTGGIPLPAIGKFGMNQYLEELQLFDPGTGYLYRYDKNNHKLKILQALGGTPGGTFTVDDHTHDLKFMGGITATEPVAIDGGDTLGKNAATNRTIVGADSATKGGVVAKTGLGGTYNGTAGDPGPFSQIPGTDTPASTTLRAIAWGK